MSPTGRPLRTLFRPDGQTEVSHVDVLVIGAHSDDVEIIAPTKTIESFTGKTRLGAVVVNDGVGKPRAAPYEDLSDEAMTRLRFDEQVAAAKRGRYEFALGLAHPSSSMRTVRNEEVVDEIVELILRTKPKCIITHNPFDRHPSHIAVLQHVLWALEKIELQDKPDELYGGEVWGCIDQIPERFLVRWDCSDLLELQEELLGYFTSQNAVKAYNVAVIARRKALARLNDPHLTLSSKAIHLGVNLKVLMTGEMTAQQLVRLCFEEMQSSLLSCYAAEK